MNTVARPFMGSAIRFAAVVTLVLASAVLLAPRASAQLGSLVVTITAPAQGATVSATIPVNASVTIVGMLTVADVQFKLDGVNLGAADTSSPYSIQWDTRTATNGSHTLTAVARDHLGVNWSSSPVTVTVFNDLTPPAVAITSPSSGANLRGAITIDATATDNVGVSGVQFRLDGANLGAEDTTAPYSIPWNTATAANGSHTLSAIARDAAGNTTTSSSVTVTVDNSAPAVSMTAPADGAHVRGSIAVTAGASDNIAVAGVQFKVDGANVGAEDTTAPYSVSWDTTAATAGSHAVTAVARDAAGNITTSSSVTVTVDNSAPAVSMTAPAGGAHVRGSVAVTAGASDNIAVAGVQFKVDGANVGAEDTTAPYSVSWDTTAATAGSHAVTAVARDAAGNITTSSSVTVTVDNSAPAVSVTAPVAGALVRSSIGVTAGASDNTAVVGVQFRIDGAALGAEDLVAPFAINWDTTTASNGSHTVSAVARDAAGNTTTSATVTLTVDNAPPAVSLTSPAASSTVSGAIAVSAAASDNVAVAGVQFRLDGAALGSEDTTAPYTVTWDTTTATNGSHSLTAVTSDTAGNVTTSAAVNVTVSNDTTPPTVAITSPAGGATVSATATITANASDDVAVAGVQFRLDGAVLGGEDTTAPYAVTWDTTTAGNGSHALTAVARDTAGNVTTSAAVNVTVSNDATPPTVAITSPAGGATVSATVTITANASDNVGVTGVQFLLNGAALGAEDTTAPYEASWDTTTAANGPHSLTATARDAAGNTTTSAAVAVTVGNTSTETVTRFEDNHSSITYTPTGSWMLGYTDSRPWSGGTTSLGFSLNQRATLNFTGTAVSWIGFRGPQTGIANVYLDNVLVATIDPYSPTETAQVALYTASGLALAPHTLAIEVTRTKNVSANDYFVIVDAFDVTAPGSGPPPDTVAPSVAVTAPGEGATLSGTTTIAATASDNVGVAGVRFLVDGAQVGPEDTAAPYEAFWNTATATNGSHALTAIARDAAGNTATSAAVTVTVSNTTSPPASSSTRIEDTEPLIIYKAGTPAPGEPDAWFHGSRSREWSNSTASFNRSANARATLAFNGTSVTWVGFRAFWAGIGRVYIDDVFVAEIDLFLPQCTPEQKAQGCVDEMVQTPVFTAAGLTPGTHTITVEASGTANAAATDNAVVLDAFDVAPAAPPPITGTRIEETTATYTSGWSQGDTTTAWSGSTAAVSTTALSRATVTFVGTEINVVGRRGPQAGIARIFLDGALQAEVDLYHVRNIQGIVYEATGLAPGSHTLAVEVTGLKNNASTGTEVAVDAFDVRSRFEERNAAVSYTGTWQQEHLDRHWSGSAPNTGGGTAARSATAGASTQFTFSGSEVRWIGWRSPTAGLADVFLDGVFMERVDLYSATETLRVALFTATGLGAGPHTLRIDVTGLKNAAATNAFVAIDAFDVVLPVPAPPVTRVQQTDASISYTTPPGTTGFQLSSPNKYFSGRTVHYATDTGSRATFTFTGTSVRWIGQRRRDAGIARVYVDGVLIGEIDSFTAIQDEFQAAVFSATGLTPGTHTVVIESTGTKNVASSGFLVIVDAFEIF